MVKKMSDRVVISRDLQNLLISYLADKPYREVSKLIPAIATAQDFEELATHWNQHVPQVPEITTKTEVTGKRTRQ